jgi:ketosteroid isomerase-like protein
MTSALLLAGLLATGSPVLAAPATPEEVLDALHARASAADFDGYFELYTDDAVFLGTDATER